MAINSAKKRVCFSTGKNMLNSLRNLRAACIAPIYTMYGKRSKHLAQYLRPKKMTIKIQAVSPLFKISSTCCRE